MLVNDPRVSNERFESVPLDELFEQAAVVIVTTDHGEVRRLHARARDTPESAVVHDGSDRAIVGTERVLDSETPWSG